MHKIIGLIIVALAIVLKLICTGLFLAIGFRLGAKIYEATETKFRKPETQTT